MRSIGIEYTENEEGHYKKKVKTLRKLVRDDEQAQDAVEETSEDEVPEGDAADGEEEHEDQADSDRKERRPGNPFRSRFDIDNPSEPEDQGAE